MSVSQVEVVEVGPRDGLQNDEVLLDTRAKVAYIEALVGALASVATAAHAAGPTVTVTIGAAFGCPFEGAVRPEQVTGIARRCAEAGVDEIALADTIGVAVPREVRTLGDAVRTVTGWPPRCHFHNTRNIGYANAPRWTPG